MSLGEVKEHIFIVNYLSSRFTRWHDVDALQTSYLVGLKSGEKNCSINFAVTFIAVWGLLLTYPVEHPTLASSLSGS